MSAKKTTTISGSLRYGGISGTWASDTTHAYQGCYQGSDGYIKDSRVGVINFSGLGGTVKNCNISEITLTVTTGKSGFNNTKKAYFKESNYQTVNTSSYSPKAYIGSDLGIVEETFYNNQKTITLNENSSSSLFTKMKDYFEKGNSILIIYSGETTTSGSADYSTNFFGWTGVTISVTYSEQGVWIYYNDSWVQAIPWIYYDGNWVQAVPWIYSGSAWTACGSG